MQRDQRCFSCKRNPCACCIPVPGPTGPAGPVGLTGPADSTVPVLVDVKRSSQFESAIEGAQWDDATLSTQLTIDALVYNQSREQHRTLIRQQDPDTGLWSLCAVNLFSSGNAARVSVWVNWIETDVTYP